MSYIGGNTNPGNYIGSHPVIGIASSFPSFRNRIINGNFDIWQRGTSQQSSGYGSADRWFNFHNGSTKTASQQSFSVGQTDVSGNPKYYLHHEVLSVTGAGNYCGTHQRIEGVTTLVGQTATVSFWAKADSNKSIATEFIQDFGTGGTPSSLVVGIGVTTHNLTTSWQKFTATVSIPHLTDTGLAGGTPKTIGTDGNDFTRLLFWFEAGSDFNTRLNSLGQPNNGTTYEVDIAQVQLEEGVATPFEHRPYGTELALCQRYYQTLSHMLAICSSSTSAQAVGMFPTSMRSTPSVNASGVLNIQGDGVINATQSAVSVSNNNSTKNSLNVSCGNFSGLVQSRALYIAVIANNSNVLILDAEL